MLVDGNDDRGIDVGVLVRAPLVIDAHPHPRVRPRRRGRRVLPRLLRVPRPHARRRRARRARQPLQVEGLQRARRPPRRRPPPPPGRPVSPRSTAACATRASTGSRSSATSTTAWTARPSPRCSPTPTCATSASTPTSSSASAAARSRAATRPAKLDHVLLSPALFERATGGAVFRRGVWHGPRTANPWEMYETLTAEVHQASDHAAIYADVDLCDAGTARRRWPVPCTSGAECRGSEAALADVTPQLASAMPDRADETVGTDSLEQRQTSSMRAISAASPWRAPSLRIRV